MLKNFFGFLLKHKFITALIIIAIIGGVIWKYKSSQSENSVTNYTLATVEKGTIVDSVSGSGQISSSDQIDIKAKVAGDVTSVLIKAGQEVKTGDVLIKLDATDAYKTIRDAEDALETTEIALAKLKEPADDYSIMQTENSLTSAKTTLSKLKLSQNTGYQEALEAKQKADDALIKAYEDTFNTVSNAFLDLPTIITNLEDMLFGDDIGEDEVMVGNNLENTSALMNTVEMIYRSRLEIFQVSAEEDYYAARTKYDENFENYKEVTRSSDNNTIESLLAETLETTKIIGEAVKSLTNYLDAWTDCRSQKNLDSFSTVEIYQTNLSSYTSKTNSHVSSLLSAQRTLQDNRESLIGAKRTLDTLDKNNPLDLAAAEATVKDKEVALAELLAEPEALDLRTQELAVKQKKNDLLDEKEKLIYYTIKAPINGIISGVSVKNGDSVSSGSIVVTIISKQQIAELSLNEVDATKLKVGQKATMTFDAVSDLTITGEVSEVDTLGEVSQGVVTYGATIVLDTQDNQIKPGMSVSASIITKTRQDVLLVPNSAIKALGDENYVEIIKNDSISYSQTATLGVVSDITPQRQIVIVGLSNDTMTEIISGVEEGDQIVTQTNTLTSSTSSSIQKNESGSLFNMTGGRFPGR